MVDKIRDRDSYLLPVDLVENLDKDYGVVEKVVISRREEVVEQEKMNEDDFYEY